MIEPNSSDKKQCINNNSRLFTIKKFAEKNKSEGIWPYSEASLWAFRANASENGFREAFLKVGRRVLVDENKFWNAIAKLQENKNESTT